MEHLAGKRHLWFTISVVLLVPGIIALALWGLRFGIDFTGGSAWEIQYTQDVNTEAISELLADHGRPEATVQQVGEDDDHRYLIRLKELPEVRPRRRRSRKRWERSPPSTRQARAWRPSAPRLGNRSATARCWPSPRHRSASSSTSPMHSATRRTPFYTGSAPSSPCSTTPSS